MAKIYVAIDPAWSYGFIGGVKGILPMHTELMDEFYALAWMYVRAQHNFLIDRDQKTFNGISGKIIERLQAYGIHPTYFEHQFRELYLQHRVAFNQIQAKINNMQCINNNLGDVIGVVCDI